jgi:hypothetical protein
MQQFFNVFLLLAHNSSFKGPIIDPETLGLLDTYLVKPLILRIITFHNTSIIIKYFDPTYTSILLLLELMSI